ncbi:MAG: NAD(P)-binding protein [Verrucomicrobiota bacterium]
MNMDKSIAVIGGGISGVSVARMLTDGSESQVVIYEKESTLGGLIRCKRTADCLYHLLGGHVFNTKTPAVKEWFEQQFILNDFAWKERNAKISIDEKTVGYPIENHLYQMDEGFQSKVVRELLQLSATDQGEFTSFGDFLIKRFGKSLCERYFFPYNHKIWGMDLAEIPVSWLEGKLPMPTVEEILLSNIQREGEKKMVHATFLYAKENGSQFIIDSLAEGLELRCECPVDNIKVSPDGLFVNGADGYDVVVYTGDITRASSVIKIEDQRANELMGRLERLKARGVKNAFCECDVTDTSWLYIPDPEFEAHRIIYTGQFSDSNNRGSDRMTCVVEFNYNTADSVICEEIGQLPGNLKLVETNKVEKAYVVQDEETRKEIDELKSILERHGLFLLGRFAEWEYYNIDKCMEAALGVSASVQAYSAL